jgi:hypothetical protein
MMAAEGGPDGPKIEVFQTVKHGRKRRPSRRAGPRRPRVECDPAEEFGILLMRLMAKGYSVSQVRAILARAPRSWSSTQRAMTAIRPAFEALKAKAGRTAG